MTAVALARPVFQRPAARLLTVLFSVIIACGLISVNSASAIAPAVATKPATKADMVAIAKTIDPRATVTWVWTPSTTFAGQAEPWNKKILISSTGVPARYLRAVMLHEWSHVLQYRAFGSDWWAAVQGFNALLGHPDDQDSYDGLEHGADCIALALGADYLGYGCPAALRVFGARIAHGVMMNKVQGALETATISKRSVSVTGWSIDPANPTRSNRVTITDNGKAVTGWVTTSGVRTDVNATTGVTGRHGFKITVTLTAGRHQICVSSMAIGSGKTAVTLSGCRTITAV